MPLDRRAGESPTLEGMSPRPHVTPFPTPPAPRSWARLSDEEVALPEARCATPLERLRLHLSGLLRPGRHVRP